MNEHEYYEKENTSAETPHRPVLDTLIQSRELQMLKAIVPYMYPPQQRMIALVIKMAELTKTLRLFDAEPEMQAAELHCCENLSASERTCQMLSAMREYCTPSEQEMVDTFLNFFDMYSSYEELFADGETL